MDLTSSLMSEVLKLGVGGILLLAAVFWLAKRDKQFQTDDRERTDKAHGQLLDTIIYNRDECNRRENEMVGRIRSLEDSRHKETSELLVRSVGALETVARIAEHVAKKDPALHKALNQK